MTKNTLTFFLGGGSSSLRVCSRPRKEHLSMSNLIFLLGRVAVPEQVDSVSGFGKGAVIEPPACSQRGSTLALESVS